MNGVCRCEMCLPAQSPCGNYDAHTHDTTDVFYPIPLDDNNIGSNDYQLFQSLR
jgi:hypothetical protein